MILTCPKCEELFDGEQHIALTPDSDDESIKCPICAHIFGVGKLLEETITHSGSSETIGHFDLMSRLGTGGFGSVWQARDTKLDRLVAIKLPHSFTTPKERQLFLREARAVAQLQHPNIVSVYEVGSNDDKLFIVSDFIQGCNLKEWLSGIKPTFQQTAQTCRTIAEALHHAHEHGVIHRDLKPANIMMDTNDVPFIMDFGLAKRETGEVSMTMDGQVMGTPMYMSPEQAKGQSNQVDRRSDVYSFGVLLFEMLTGEKPFRGEPRMVMSQIISKEAPSPKSLNNNIPKDLETICLKCLEKEPSSRYASGQDVADELRRFLNGEPIEARPISNVTRALRWCRRRPVVSGLTAALLTAIILGSAGYAWQLHRANMHWQRAEKAAFALTLEEEKQKFIYVAHLSKIQSLYERGMLDGARELLDSYNHKPNEPDQRTFEWFYFDALCRAASSIAPMEYGKIVSTVAAQRHGTLVALAGEDAQIQVWDSQTHEKIGDLIGHQHKVKQMCFSENGRLLLSSDRTSLRLWEVDTGQFNCVYELENSSWQEARFSPDAKFLAIPDGKRVILIDTNSMQKFHFDGHDDVVNDLQFQHSGKGLISCSRDGSILQWDLSIPKSPTLIVDQESGIDSIEISDDDQKLAYSYGKQLAIKSLGSADKPSLVANLFQPTQGLLSLNDGKHFAVVQSDEISFWDFEEGNWRGRLGDPDQFKNRLRVSPNGSHFATSGEGNAAYVFSTSDFELRKVIRGHSNNIYDMAFLQDGLLTGSRDQCAKIWPSLDPTNSLTLANSTEWNWSTAFSSDSKYLATASADTDVTIWNTTNGKHVATLDLHERSVQFVTFSSDGRYLASCGHDKTIRLWNVEDWSPAAVLKGHSAAVNSLDFSPDCKWLVSGADGGQVIIWDVENHTEKHRYQTENKRNIWAVSFARDGKTVAFGGTDERVSQWKFGETELPQVLHDLGASVTSLHFSKSGSQLAFTDSKGLITVWNHDQGTQQYRMIAHSGDAMHVGFSPDGRTLVSGGSDGTVQFWNLNTGEPTVAFEMAQHVHCVAFSPDGSMVAATSWDGTTKLWTTK